MPRLPVIEPEQASGRAKELFEGPLKGKELNIFKGLANAPAALDAYLGMSKALSGAKLSSGEQEVIHLAVSQENGCGYCLAAHSALGSKAGLSDEQVLGARRGAIDDPKLGALARFAKTLHEKKGFVSDQDMRSLKDAGYTDEHLVEAIATYALATFTNYFNHVNETAVDFPDVPSI